jgi:hypothetical protein
MGEEKAAGVLAIVSSWADVWERPSSCNSACSVGNSVAGWRVSEAANVVAAEALGIRICVLISMPFALLALVGLSVKSRLLSSRPRLSIRWRAGGVIGVASSASIPMTAERIWPIPPSTISSSPLLALLDNAGAPVATELLELLPLGRIETI